MAAKLRHLDLFSGIGGFALGLRRTGGFETVGFCEIDPYCRRVLAKHWPDVPRHDDVRTFDATGLGSVDLLTGGYPCQPFSHAGQRRGEEDDRHLWPEVARLLAAVRPRWFIGENVAGHVTMGLDDVLSDLEGLGYTCWPAVIPACAVDAPHRRDRVWIVGHAPDIRCGQGEHEKSSSQSREQAGERRVQQFGGTSIPHGHANGQGEPAQPVDGERQGGAVRQRCTTRGRGGECGSETLANPSSARLEIRQGERSDTGAERQAAERSGGAIWQPEPNVGRVANGIPRRVDRLRALGNAVVPQVVTELGHAILQAEAAP